MTKNTNHTPFVPTRRDFLNHAVPGAALAATGAALALPAGAAVAAVELPVGTDPLLALWAQRQAVVAEIGEDRFDDAPELFKRQWEIEQEIADTVPSSPEGVAIVATVLLIWYQEGVDNGDGKEVEARAGATLARYILDNAPAELRAMVGEA